jgi:hypothetical protein
MGEEGGEEMGKHASIKALEDYAYVSPDTVGEKEVIASLFVESDRAAIIVCASLLEEALTEAISAKLRKMSNTEREDLGLFEQKGLISGFGQKLDMAYAMEVIDLPMWRLLDHLRYLRNCCAHAFRPMKLDSVPIFKTACETVFRDEWRAIIPETFAQTPASLKEAIVTECMALTVAIKHGRERAKQFLRATMMEIEREAKREPRPTA